MRIKSYFTLSGARRASPEGPILRLLDDPVNLFIAGLPGRGLIMAVDPRTGKADGSITVLDLMAGDVRPASALRSILSLLGNVDHSRGGGENAARVYGGMLESIREIATASAREVAPAGPLPAGDDQRQGVTPAGRAVLDLVDRERVPNVKSIDLSRRAEQFAGESRFGRLKERREMAVRAAALALLAVEAIDSEFVG